MRQHDAPSLSAFGAAVYLTRTMTSNPSKRSSSRCAKTHYLSPSFMYRWQQDASVDEMIAFSHNQGNYGDDKGAPLSYASRFDLQADDRAIRK
jgi:hypothetical protein